MSLIYDLTFARGKGHALQIKSLKLASTLKHNLHGLLQPSFFNMCPEPTIQSVEAAICQMTNLSSDKTRAAPLIIDWRLTSENFEHCSLTQAHKYTLV